MAQRYHEENGRLTRAMQNCIEKVIQNLEIGNSSAEEDAFVIESSIRGLIEAADEYLHMTNRLKLDLITMNSANNFYQKYVKANQAAKEEISNLLKETKDV